MIDVAAQRAKAERLRAYHHGPPILVLPNAWDVASATRFAAVARIARAVDLPLTADLEARSAKLAA